MNLIFSREKFLLIADPLPKPLPRRRQRQPWPLLSCIRPGSPLAAAAGIVILDTVNKPGFLKEIVRKGAKFESIIKGWKIPKVKEIRARDLMLGVDITEEAWPVLEKGISRVYNEKDAHGLLLLSAGRNTLRLLPPYIVSDAEIEQGLEILLSCL